jgi:putative transposase
MEDRKRPVHGVEFHPNRPTIIFITVCTKDRKPWLASHDVHMRLLTIWNESQFWKVGRYIIMPDHIHMFVAESSVSFPLKNWMKYWKSQCSKRRADPTERWQDDYWDRRLRTNESYDEKWEYVKANPVRAGLATNFEDWPFQGEMNRLEWE